jgi:chromosome segregation ATPase
MRRELPMFYLVSQIALILVIAVLAGLAVGWWVRGWLPTGGSFAVKTLPDDPFDARFRLEQCHRDNSALRRDLKEAEAQVEKLKGRLENAETSDGDVQERLEIAEVRVQALLEDLQLRDDTVAALEQELLLLRSKA